MACVLPKYHIIGAGIAGLSVAQLLLHKYPNAEIVVYEAADHPGGRCSSFFDRKSGLSLDGATHVILGANRHAAKFIGADSFDGKADFYDLTDGKIHSGLTENINDKALSLFNLPLGEAARKIVLKTFFMLFPFLPSDLKVWFSKGDLSQKLIEPLSKNIIIKTGWKLRCFHEKDGVIYKLDFNKGSIALLPNDKVISALDATNYARIFGGAEFEYNEIINIFYRTSMQIGLPGNRRFIGICGGSAQWLFTSPGLLAVTISNAKLDINNDDLAINIWKEICVLRGHAAAFLPTYRVVRNKRATIRQDKANNDKRPTSCQTQWKNMLICGDWTMRNQPCSIETAIASARRVVK